MAVSLAAATAFVGVWVVGRWFCRWRIIKPVFIAGAGLVGLIVLFYAEEVWRRWLMRQSAATAERACRPAFMAPRAEVTGCQGAG